MLDAGRAHMRYTVRFHTHTSLRARIAKCDPTDNFHEYGSVAYALTANSHTLLSEGNKAQTAGTRKSTRCSVLPENPLTLGRACENLR